VVSFLQPASTSFLVENRQTLEWSLCMTIGMIFYIVAAVIFLLTGMGTTLVGPHAMTWGFFCIAVGLALNDIGFGAFRRR
jgi:hypothetical protein